MENEKLLELKAFLSVNSGFLIESLSRKYFTGDTGKMKEHERWYIDNLLRHLVECVEEDDGKQ